VKALGIARVSTERQSANDRVSHGEQAERIRRWCTANGYECLDVLYETVSRATELDPDDRERRPIFWRAWDQLKGGQVDALVFWTPDRFCAALNGADFTYWVAKARQYGDGIRFAENEPPRDGAYTTVMTAIASSQAAADYARIVERMTVGREGRARRGKFAGGSLPFWICWVRPVRNGDGSTTPGRFELNEPDATLVRRIIALYESGLGSERIANTLTEERVPTPSTRNPQWRTHAKKRPAAVWDGATVLGILHNAALFGEYHFGGRRRGKIGTRPQEPVIIPVPALITKEHYDAIQRRTLDNRKFHSERGAKGWPLQGLIWSESCGFHYGLRSDGRTGRRVYRCPGRMAKRHRDGQKCSCPALPADAIERAVAAALRKLLKDRDARRQAVGDYIAGLESRKAALVAQLGPIDSELARIQKHVDDLTVAVTMDRLSPVRYDQEVAKLEEQRRKLRGRRDNFEAVEQELRQVEDSLADIHNAVDEGLLHVSVIARGGHGKPSAIEWRDVDSEDFILRQESFADLARRLRLRVVVRRDGHVEATGMFQPIEVKGSVPSGPRATPVYRHRLPN
jgi:DNA invertase Pin-like site-specific DNA recombinase